MFFKSFTKFNAYLLAHTQRYTLDDYISLSQQVGFYPVFNSDNVRMTSIILFINDIIHRDSSCSNFIILISELERIGFFIEDTIGNKVRSIFKIPRDNLKNEQTFIKKYKLIQDIDYELASNRIEEFQVEINYGYSITPMAFYKILNKSFDGVFMGMLMLRLSQIKHYYDLYVSTHMEETIARLESINKGLMEDINNLTMEYPNIKRSKVFSFDKDRNNSYDSNDHKKNTPNNSLLSDLKADQGVIPSSVSPIDIMLEDTFANKYNDDSVYSAQLSEMNQRLIDQINSPHGSSMRAHLKQTLAYRDSDSDLDSSKISLASDSSNSMANIIDGMVEREIVDTNSRRKRYSLTSASSDHISALKKKFTKHIDNKSETKRSR